VFVLQFRFKPLPEHLLGKLRKIMKITTMIAAGVLLAVTQMSAYAGDNDGEDRRDERGRSDERQDKRDCRQEEGVVGKDKRDCKQEEVRDGVRGNQGERGGDNDNDDDNND
jgi:hypothetical protein